MICKVSVFHCKKEKVIIKYFPQKHESHGVLVFFVPLWDIKLNELF
jgi:hypothetical protein